eukprot:TRINITY_DN762_c1_g1_i1.p1 TRINITY_DN762_c1_g1~~TRINITY_DN762_c1_g1_i1.p1  ORF type:complete len:1434 (+),score=327.74 TRINITY_DN762_c1_g1_i1:70-4371(+)
MKLRRSRPLRVAVTVVALLSRLPSCSALDPLLTYTYKETGTSKLLCDGKCRACPNGGWSRVDEDCYDDTFCLSNQYSQGSCWGGAYSDSNYPTSKGEITKSDGSKLNAYQVSPTAQPASSFAASGSEIYYKFPTKEDYVIYSWTQANGFKKLKDVEAAKITLGEHTATGVTVNGKGRTEDMLLVFAAGQLRTSAWPQLGAGVEAATVSTAGGINIDIHRYETDGQPFDATADYTKGPNGNVYGTYKRFFPFLYSDGAEGVMWQDVKDYKVYHSKIAADKATAVHTEVPTGGNEFILAGASGNGQGVVIYVLMKKGTGADKDSTIPAKIVKLDCNTNTEMKKRNLDTAAMDIYDFWHASMLWNPERCEVTMYLGRRATKSGDGLNHQSCTMAIFNDEDLSDVKNYGLMTSHCWAESLAIQKNGDWMAIDIGDNFPRGVSVLGISDKRLKRARVYTYKTRHAGSAGSCAKCKEVYTEISDSTCPGSGKCFYRWSNDNAVYTEIAHSGLLEVPDGVMAFFAGERDSMDGLDNSKVGSWEDRKATRQLGFVKIEPCTSDACTGTVLSPGPTRKSAYYSYFGGATDQEMSGINWLTSYKYDDEENVSRPKTLRLGTLNTLVWEVWTKDNFKRTSMMTIDDAGKPKQAAVDSAYGFMMPMSDDPVMRGGKFVIYTGAGPGREGPGSTASSPPLTSKLIRIELSFPGSTGGDGPAPDGASPPMVAVPGQGDCPAPEPSVAPTAAPAGPPSASPSASPNGPSVAPSAPPSLAPVAPPTAAPAPGAQPSAAPAPPPGSPSAAPVGPPGAPTAAPAAGPQPSMSPAAPGPQGSPSASPAPPMGAPTASPAAASTSGTPGSPTAAPAVASGGATGGAAPTASPVVATGGATGGAPSMSPAGATSGGATSGGGGSPSQSPAAASTGATGGGGGAPSMSPAAAATTGATGGASSGGATGGATGGGAGQSPLDKDGETPSFKFQVAPVWRASPEFVASPAYDALGSPQQVLRTSPSYIGAPGTLHAPEYKYFAAPVWESPLDRYGETPEYKSRTRRDECVPVSPCGDEQDCFDPDVSSDMLLDFECVCKVAAKGGGIARARGTRARCGVDECRTRPCGSEQFCNDPNQTALSTSQTTEAAGFRDFVCTCKDGSVRVGGPADCGGKDPAVLCNGVTCGGGQACVGGLCQCMYPTYGVAPGTAADCRMDDCYAGSVEVCGQGQMCTDPDTRRAQNYVCACLPPFAGAAVGARASCRFDDCAGDPCGPLQTCTDPFPDQPGMYLCHCNGGGAHKAARNRPAYGCTTATETLLPGEVIRGAAGATDESARRLATILGILLGVVLCCCCLLLFFLWRRRKQRRGPPPARFHEAFESAGAPPSMQSAQHMGTYRSYQHGVPRGGSTTGSVHSAMQEMGQTNKSSAGMSAVGGEGSSFHGSEQMGNTNRELYSV